MAKFKQANQADDEPNPEPSNTFRPEEGDGGKSGSGEAGLATGAAPQPGEEVGAEQGDDAKQ